MGKRQNKERVYTQEEQYHEHDGSQLERKKFHIKDLCNLQAKSDNQYEFIESYLNTDIETFALVGYPGTGKSFLAIRCGMDDVLCPDTDYRQLVIFRSEVDLRDNGFKPGTTDEKALVYAKPYIGLMQDIFSISYKNIFENLCKVGKLSFETTSNQRGTTYNDAIFVIDEFQNMNYEEIRTIYTRAGRNCRIIFCGDKQQNDLRRKRNDKSGLDQWMRLLGAMSDVSIHEFYDLNDIVRDDRIRDMIEAEIKLGFV